MNRTLITYARVFKGQYWLSEFEIDFNRLYTHFAAFRAQGQIDDGDTFLFIPSRDRIFIVDSGEDLYIHENDWPDVVHFVTGDQRTPLVAELLAGAKKLAAQGYSRSALTEAVTALEVALFNFARQTPCKEKLASVYGTRINTESLEKQISRLGLTKSFDYFLPLLLPNSVLPESILSDCQEAIAKRQTVVHQGQRDVPKIETYIGSIEECCDILAQYCTEND